MKYLLSLVVSAVLFASASKADEADIVALINNHHRACTERTHLEPAVLKQMQNERKILADEKAREHALCYAKEAHLTEDGLTPNVDVIRVKLMVQLQDEGKVNEVMTKCEGLQDPKPTEYVAKMMQCYMDNLPKNIHII